MLRSVRTIGLGLAFALVSGAAGAQVKPVLVTYVSPGTFTLQGGGVSVKYVASGTDGKAHVNYADANISRTFDDTEVRVAYDADLGTLVSVTTRLTIDSGRTTFTLVVPDVNVAKGSSANVSTVGITTVHKFSTLPPMLDGQDDLFTSVSLTGTAQDSAPYAGAVAASTAVQQGQSKNLYQLGAAGTHVQVALKSFTGAAIFSYQTANATSTFTGPTVRLKATDDLGLMASVTLGGGLPTTYTVLLPRVQYPSGNGGIPQSISTPAITTTRSSAGATLPGQTSTSTLTMLTGKVQEVSF